MTNLRHKQLTGKIIGCYYDVYNGTGRTYPEFIYERALVGDLQRAGVACRRQKEYEIFYKDKKIGHQRLDLFVADEVVVEIKVVPQLAKLHKAQTFSYLKVVGREVGLLCNFGSPHPEFERLYFKSRSAETPTETKTVPQFEQLTTFLSPKLTGTVIEGLFQVHTILGPGFIHRIYANATYHELLLRHLEVLPRREYQVIYRQQVIGEIKFNHLQIGDMLMVFPVAIQDIGALSINNLKAWMRYQNIPLGILANFHATRLEMVVLRADHNDLRDQEQQTRRT